MHGEYEGLGGTFELSRSEATCLLTHTAQRRSLWGVVWLCSSQHMAPDTCRGMYCRTVMATNAVGHRTPAACPCRSRLDRGVAWGLVHSQVVYRYRTLPSDRLQLYNYEFMYTAVSIIIYIGVDVACARYVHA